MLRADVIGALNRRLRVLAKPLPPPKPLHRLKPKPPVNDDVEEGEEGEKEGERQAQRLLHMASGVLLLSTLLWQ